MGYINEPPALIHPSILVGAGHMLTSEFIQKHQITHIINCAYPEDCPAMVQIEFGSKYKCMHADDGHDVNILKWYPEFKQTLTRFLQDSTRKRVFVHCQCGINRSMFLTATYVCEVFGYPYDITCRALKQQRPCAMRNTTFNKQVGEFLVKKIE